MARRKLEELNLLDDFLFGTILNDPKFGKKFAQILLKIILKRELEDLKIVPQKVFYGSNTDKHGARLDVYLEAYLAEKSDRETVIDVEPDKNSKRKYVENLPKRTRFYHAVIDAECLKSGKDYKALKDVVVIMITTYDPFGLNQMVYTIKNKCEERDDLEYEDGAKTLYLYTDGEQGNASQELKELLHYMAETTEENACNEDLRELHEMVKLVKQDRGVTLEFMKIFEREQMLIEEALEEERMKHFEREQMLIEEALEEERMKYFEREQMLIEEAKEEERQRHLEEQKTLKERLKETEAQLEKLKEELQRMVS